MPNSVIVIKFSSRPRASSRQGSFPRRYSYEAGNVFEGSALQKCPALHGIRRAIEGILDPARTRSAYSASHRSKQNLLYKCENLNVVGISIIIGGRPSRAANYFLLLTFCRVEINGSKSAHSGH